MSIDLGHETVVVEAPGVTVVDAEGIEIEVIVEPPLSPVVSFTSEGPTFVEAPSTDVGTVVPVAGSPGSPGAPGAPGAPGEPGPPGPPGAGGASYDFNFATPSTTWVVQHNLGTFAVQVETFDQTGALMEGYVNYPDANTAEVTFYYPTAGMARVIT